jgi:hypothetical protein
MTEAYGVSQTKTRAISIGTTVVSKLEKLGIPASLDPGGEIQVLVDIPPNYLKTLVFTIRETSTRMLTPSGHLVCRFNAITEEDFSLPVKEIPETQDKLVQVLVSESKARYETLLKFLGETSRDKKTRVDRRQGSSLETLKNEFPDYAPHLCIRDGKLTFITFGNEDEMRIFLRLLATCKKIGVIPRPHP